MDNLVIVDHDVTCHTDDCENLDIVIRIPAVQGSPIVICGACGNNIEDVIEVG